MALNDAPLPASRRTQITGAGFLALVTPDGIDYGLPINGILGVLPNDVTPGLATSGTISTRLSVVTGTTPTVSLPSVSGNLREVFIINTASGNCTVDTPGSEKILTGTADADTLVIATGKTAHLMSDGTRWYHVSNDA